jgi:hypothetical protein
LLLPACALSPSYSCSIFIRHTRHCEGPRNTGAAGAATTLPPDHGHDTDHETDHEDDHDHGHDTDHEDDHHHGSSIVSTTTLATVTTPPAETPSSTAAVESATSTGGAAAFQVANAMGVALLGFAVAMAN